RERTALAGEVVTGRAVEAEQLATTSRVVPLERLARLVRFLRAATVRLDVGAERVDLLGRVLRRLARGLCLLAHHRHPAAGDLEVHRRLADTHEARALVLDALEVRAVARDAGVVVDLLALAHLGGTGLRLGRLGLGSEHGVQPACADQRHRERGESGDTPTELRAAPRSPVARRGGLLRGGHLLRQPLLSVRPYLEERITVVNAS